MDDHEHAWELYEETDAIRRYACGCGMKGWGPRFGKPGSRVRPYKHEPAPLRAEVTASPRAAGRNATGGYLPPGGY